MKTIRIREQDKESAVLALRRVKIRAMLAPNGIGVWAEARSIQHLMDMIDARKCSYKPNWEQCMEMGV